MMNRSESLNEFGANSKRVQEFIESLQTYPWLVNLGKPHPKDEVLLRVYTIEDAWEILPSLKAYRSRKLRERREASAKAKQLGVEGHLTEQGKAAIAAYYAVKAIAKGKDLDIHIMGKAAFAAFMAAGDLVWAGILVDPPHHGLDLMPWFKQGHWPVGFNDDNKLVLL